ncbi:MAG: hypothetical protein OEZ32_10830 [Nitrospinota bacterium]|nr:hypothetical protein [Nitrospinota bacterium]
MEEFTIIDNNTPDSRRTSLLEAAVVLTSFMALGLVFTWPLAKYYLSGLTYGYDADPAYYTTPMYMGDHLQYYYHLGLLKYAAIGRIEWFTNPFEFATEYRPGWLFLYSLPLSAVMYLPFSFVSMTFAYNTFMLLGITLGGLCMYLWAKELTGNRVAAFFAGVVFNFLPIRMVEILGGHPSGHILFLFPLALYFLDRAVRRRSALDGALCGVTSLVLSLQYNFFAYFLFMFMMAYIPWRLIPAIRADLALMGASPVVSPVTRLKPLALVLFSMGIGFLASIGWMLFFKKTMVEQSTMGHGREWGEVENFSPPIWAAWNVARGYEVYLGLAVVFALAALILLAGRLVRDRSERWDIVFFLALFAGSYLLAFGTALDEYFPLYKLFYKYFPYFNLSRSPTKIMIIVMACVGALAAYSMKWLFERRAPWPRAAAGLFMLALVLDFHPGKPVGICLLDQGSEAYQFIARTGEGKPVLNLPIWPGESSWESIYQYYAVDSGTPMINGYSPLVKKDYVDHVFWPLSPMNGGDMAQIQVDTARELGVGYVVFHADAYPPKVGAFSPYIAIARLMESPYLELAYKQDPLWIFRVRENPAPYVPPSPPRLGSLFQAEWLNWIGGRRAEDKDSSRGWALKATPGPDMPEDGIVNAGPYATFPAGRYKARIRLKMESGGAMDGPVVMVDVAADQGKVLLAKRTINADEFTQAGVYQEFELEYDLAPGRFWQVEYRVYLQGAATIFFDYVYVTSTDEPGGEGQFEAEELRYYSGRLVESPQASGGQAMRSMPGINPEDVMMFGPGTMIEPGRWRAVARMMVEDSDSEGGMAGALEVWLDGEEETAAARQEVRASSLGGAGRWADISLEFDVARRGTVEVAVKFGGKVPLLVDTIRLEKVAR